MASYRLTLEAEEDLKEIAVYTIENWGHDLLVTKYSFHYIFTSPKLVRSLA